MFGNKQTSGIRGKAMAAHDRECPRHSRLPAVNQRPARRAWTFAAVCVMVASLTLLIFGPARGPMIQLLPWYVAAYLLIGACIFGPPRNVVYLRQIAAFLLPGALLVPLALLNAGVWAGGWLLGSPRGDCC